MSCRVWEYGRNAGSIKRALGKGATKFELSYSHVKLTRFCGEGRIHRTPAAPSPTIGTKTGILAGLGSLPTLRLSSGAGLPDLAILNKAVAEARQQLARFRAAMGPSVIHLFVKGPSFIGMALGHRLNGLSDFQLYDRMGSDYAWPARLTKV